MNGVILSQDWANLKNYKKQNAKLGSPKANENRIVFYGNSITEIWKYHFLSPNSSTGNCSPIF